MKRIMIIEDDTALRTELSVLLQNAGYETLPVEDFTNVAAQMKASGADLFLLDINLPNVSGETLLQEFRKQSDTHVIMLTSRTTEIDEVLSMSFGADDYITKPYNPTFCCCVSPPCSSVPAGRLRRRCTTMPRSAPSAAASPATAPSRSSPRMR